MTRKNNEQMPLPKQNDYLNAVFHLVSEPREEGVSLRASINRYSFNKQHDSLAMIRYTERFCYIGLCLEELDHSTGKTLDERAQKANAFAYGATTGAMITEFVHKGLVTPGALVDRMQPFIDSSDEDDDEIELKHRIGLQVIERGRLGLSLMGRATESMLERLETEVVPDTADRYMFRIGCGMVALGAYGIHRAIDQKAF